MAQVQLSPAGRKMLRCYRDNKRWNGKQWNAAANLLKRGLIAYDADRRGPFITEAGRALVRKRA